MSDYERDIEIDESALDVEWLEQPQLMRRYCHLAAHAHQAMLLAEERLNFVKSTLARDIRADPAAFEVMPGSRGITEDQIKAATRIQESYRAASRSYISAQYEYEVAQGAVRSFDQRKSALENLVRMHGQQYFAGPSVPRDLSAERQRRGADRLAQRNVRVPRVAAATSGRAPEASGDDGEGERPRPRFERRS